MSSPGRRSGFVPTDISSEDLNVSKSSASPLKSRRVAVKSKSSGTVECIPGYPTECTVLASNVPFNYNPQTFNTFMSWHCPIIAVQETDRDARKKPDDPRKFFIVVASPNMADKLCVMKGIVLQGKQLLFEPTVPLKSMFEKIMSFFGRASTDKNEEDPESP